MKSLLGSVVEAFNRTPVPFVSNRAPGVLTPRRAAGEAQMEAYGAVSTLFQIVNRLANTTAQVDWKLYRKAASGIEDERVEVTRHAALDLWNRPNKFYTRQEFVETFQQHIDLTGEGWWVVGRNENYRSIPLELWPVRPDRMSPVPHPKDFLSGYVYLGPDGEKVPLGLDDVIQLRMPNPLDPYRGIGPVQSIQTQINSSRYSAQWNLNFFLNSARPGGMIEVPESLSDADFERLKYRWNEQHKGVSNAHRVAILEHGKWVETKYTHEEMQFSELDRMSREAIREAFGYPKPMLGAVDDVNRANAEAAEVVFARWLLVPRLERIKQALNNDLLPLFGTTTQGLEFDYCNPVPESLEDINAERKSKTEAFVQLVKIGVNEDDAAAYCGLPVMRIDRPAVTGGVPNAGGSGQAE